MHRTLLHSQPLLKCVILYLLASNTLVEALADNKISSKYLPDDLLQPIPQENPQSAFRFFQDHSNEASKERGHVSLPVDNPTKSFWLDTKGANPLAEEGSTGKLTQDADVCVIGSGITGVSAAWHLSKTLSEDERLDSRDRTSVVVLEARRFCSGATGRNGGNLTPFMFSSFLSRQAAHNTSEAVKSFVLEQYTADALVRFITDKNLENEVDLVEGGHVTMFYTKKEELDARKDWEAAKAAGLDVNATWIGQQEMVQKYGINRELNYTGVFFAAHNLWPCKLVTHLFKFAQSTSGSVDVSLHTKTPVTAITRESKPHSDEIPVSSTTRSRRWKLHTPRGGVSCTYVVHATNAYAAHLLPFLGGVTEGVVDSSSSSFFLDSTEDRPPPEEHSQPPPRPPATLSRWMYGILPIRGHVGAIRAAVGPSKLGWQNSWGVGDGGLEYWFPRYQDSQDRSSLTRNDTNSVVRNNPLIILGGGHDAGVTDDSGTNRLVSKALRSFLPRIFPAQFSNPAATDQGGIGQAGDGWEMEWTGIMGFTKGGDPFVGPVISPLEFGTELDTQDIHYEGQYIAAGYSGHGMPRAYACAEVIAGMIKAQMRGEKWTRPSWFPERYLTWAPPS